MHLDTPTVSFITVLVVFLECGILTALWMIHRGMPGLALWAAGTLAISFGVLGIYLRGSLPPSVSIIFVNLVIHAGLILTWLGIEAFFQRPLPYRWGLAILALSAAGLLYFTFINTAAPPRIVFLMCISAMLAALRAGSLLRDLRPATRFSQILASIPLICQGLFSLALAVAAWRLPPSGQAITQVSISGWIFLIPMLLSIAVVFTAVLLVNQTIAARLQEAARQDPLTGALTRRALEEAGEIEVVRSRRHGSALSMLLLDIDHFKLINDKHGHPVGDVVLRQFSERVRQCLRREDMFGRIGGEEFCALLPSTPVEGAVNLAERIRGAIADLRIDAGDEMLSIEVSIGVAAFGTHGVDWSDVTRHADAALYAAKRAGRNQVVMADAP